MSSDNLFCVKTIALNEILHIGGKNFCEEHCDKENIRAGCAKYYVGRYSLKKDFIINPALPPNLILPPRLLSDGRKSRIHEFFEAQHSGVDSSKNDDNVKNRVKKYLDKFKTKTNT